MEHIRLPGFNFTRLPWAHQVEGILRAREKHCFGYFFEVGTGKSFTLINLLRLKFNTTKKFKRTLIFCPPIVCENWKREWLENSNVQESDILILKGPGKKRLTDLQKSKAKIVITNYESLLMKDLYLEFFKSGFEVLVCDESHKLKDGTAQRSKKMTALADNIDEKYLLSGTPVLNSLMDLWSQFRIMDGGYTLGKNFFVFRNTFFYDKNAGAPSFVTFRDWRPRPNADEEIKRKIAPYCMTVKKQDCLDLPPFVKKEIRIEMAPEQRRAYEAMEKDFIAMITDSQAAVAELAITKALRLQQIVSGFVPVELGLGEREAVAFKENTRLDALQELLEELTPNHKVIVWAVFKHNFKQIRELCSKMEIPAVEVHGEVTAKGKQDAVDTFNRDPKCRVFIGHPASGGIGINLVASDISIFYSRNFSLENDLQAEARNYRGGSEQHKSITRIDLVAGGTIDEDVLSALSQKIQIGEKVLRAWADRKRDTNERGTCG